VLIVICVYTMSGALPIFPTFECEDLNNAGPRWTKWLSRFEVLLSAMVMDVRDTKPEQKRKTALLLHYMGAECYDIYETLKNEEDYSAVKTKMNDYFVPKYNSEFERSIFIHASQKGENLDQFCTRLKQLSVNCDYRRHSGK